MPAKLQLRLLGAPEALLDGQPLTDLKIRKTQAILYFLAATRRPQRRTSLVGLFWGNLPESLAATNLRKSLSQLRSQLDPFLLIDRETVVLKAGPDIGVDVTEFASKAEHPRTQDPRQLEAAIGLYRGDFLEGFYVREAPEFEQWVEIERGRLRELAMGVYEALAGWYAGRGDLGQAISQLRRVVALEPWREEAHRELMSLLARDGQRGAALAQYEACRQALRKELDVEPGPETQQVYESIRTGQLAAARRPSATTGGPPSQVPGAQRSGAEPAWPPELSGPGPAGGSGAARHDLPAQLTTFVGREAEWATLTAQLAAPGYRLVTVVGPGGMGKTRLALEVAAGQLDRYADGIFFVSLASLSAPEFMAGAIANAVGCSLQAAQDPRATLLAFLRDRQMLLIMDNCEHLLDGIDLVSQLLQAAPGLQVLATSRERLNLQGEWVFDLGGLAFPPAREAVEQAEGYGAVRLFVERAQQGRRDFTPTGQLPFVAEICRLVEGMPLGLELAAAWTRSLSCAEITKELAQRLDRLEARQRDVPERHRSLRAVCDHSWALLTGEEQAALRKLAVFGGGWIREAAAEVAGASPELLAGLLDKSLIRRDASGRYGMHELMRQYAVARLREAGEDTATSERHAAFFLAFVERAELELLGPAQLASVARLNADYDNVRAALGWALSHPATETALRLVGALEQYWLDRGLGIEGSRWAEQVLAAAHALPPSAALAKAWYTAGQMSLVTSDYSGAVTRQTVALAMAQEVGATLLVARALVCLGFARLQEQGDYAGARASLQEGLAMQRRLDDKWGVAGALNLLGYASLTEGNYENARSLFEESIALFREIGDWCSAAGGLNLLAQVAVAEGQALRAAELINEAMPLLRESGSIFELVTSAEVLASAYAALGRPERAVRILAAADARRTSLNSPVWPSARSAHKQVLDELVASLGQERFGALWAEGQALSLEQALAEQQD